MHRATPDFTVKLKVMEPKKFTLISGDKRTELKEVAKLLELKSGTRVKEKDGAVVCFDLAKGESVIV